MTSKVVALKGLYKSARKIKKHLKKKGKGRKERNKEIKTMKSINKVVVTVQSSKIQCSRVNFRKRYLFWLDMSLDRIY